MRIITLAVVLWRLAVPLLGQETPTLEETAIIVYQSLTPAQRDKAVLPLDSPERHSQQFTGGPRAGVQLRDLNDQQRNLAKSLLTSFTSEYGAQKCVAVANQDPGGLDRFYLCFFGEPGPGKSYAWRIAEHHLTLVHVEVEKGEAQVFGPILLGANPPLLWNNEEDAMIALYAAMTTEQRAKAARDGVGISSQAFDEGGLRVSELNESAKQKLIDLFDLRLKFFSEAIQQRIRTMVEQQGGLDAMRIAFWGKADKRCADGGRWDFKLAGESFLCDYENSREHIHMAMKGMVKSPMPKPQ